MQQEPHYYRIVYRKSKIHESFVLIIKYNRWALKPPETLASSQSEATSRSVRASRLGEHCAHLNSGSMLAAFFFEILNSITQRRYNVPATGGT